MSLIRDNDIEKIKESFNALNEKAPDFIWGNLDRQLYIDRVWLRIKKRLDQIYTVRRRKTVIVSIAASLIVAFFVTLTFFYKFEYKNHTSIKEYGRKNFVVPKERQNKLYVNNKINHGQKYSNIPLTTFPLNTSQNIDQIATLNTKYSDSFSLIANIKNDSIQYNIGVKESPSYIQVIRIKSVFLKDESKIIVANKKGNDSIFNFYARKRKTHYEIGLIYSLNNTILINNQTKASYTETSLVDRIPTFTSNYGLVFNYCFSLKSAIAVEYLFANKENQILGIYKNGRYYQKNLKLDYARLTLMYQKNLYSIKNKVFSNYFIKGGCYFAYLKSIANYYQNNNEIIYDTTDDYSSGDYGVKLSIGVEKNVKKLIFGCGFGSEYGLKNIFIGNNSTPPEFDRTNNFNLGINFIIKYKIN